MSTSDESCKPADDKSKTCGHLRTTDKENDLFLIEETIQRFRDLMESEDRRGEENPYSLLKDHRDNISSVQAGERQEKPTDGKQEQDKQQNVNTPEPAERKQEQNQRQSFRIQQAKETADLPTKEEQRRRQQFNGSRSLAEKNPERLETRKTEDQERNVGRKFLKNPTEREHEKDQQQHLNHLEGGEKPEIRSAGPHVNQDTQVTGGDKAADLKLGPSRQDASVDSQDTSRPMQTHDFDKDYLSGEDQGGETDTLSDQEKLSDRHTVIYGDKLSGTDKPSDSEKLSETDEPCDGEQLSGTDKPSDGEKFSETDKPSDGEQLSGTDKPSDSEQLSGTDKQSDGEKSSGTDKLSKGRSGTDKLGDGDKLSGTDKLSDGDKMSGTDKLSDGDKMSGTDQLSDVMEVVEADEDVLEMGGSKWTCSRLARSVVRCCGVLDHRSLIKVLCKPLTIDPVERSVVSDDDDSDGDSF